MERRKRILWCNEFHLLATGYSTYGKEVISRLYNMDKYDIAEFALYVSPSDPKIKSAKWKVYANAPEDGAYAPVQKEQVEQYHANPICQFGAWRFDEVVLDFKPDIVISIMDPWMFEHISQSPLRPFFHFIIMPTVDSTPQQESWINMFIDADAVFTYTDYGLKVLEQEGGGLIKLEGTASPAADVIAFNPVADKINHKANFGLRSDINIIGTVMRNQKRKLYPELLGSYQLFLQKCYDNGQYDLAANTLMYWHVTYPDVGWDIPDLLKKYGLSHRVLMTYLCRKCHYVWPSFYQEPRTFCPACGDYSAGLPNTQTGVDDKILGQIMNLFDVYVQYVIAEGFGMPVVEAAACGIPVIATNYSAMEDILPKIKGIPIKIQTKFLEAETQAYRVYPDNTELANELYKFFNLPEPIRRKKSADTRKGFEAHYNYDTTAKQWSRVFDKLTPKDIWNIPPALHNPVTQLPNNLTNAQFVQWAIVNILGEPHRLGSYLQLKLTKDLNYGAYIPGFGGNYLSDQSIVGNKPIYQKFHREDAANILYQMRQTKNFWEQRRTNMISVELPDFIKLSKPDNRAIT